MPCYLGIDVGGSHITLDLVDAETMTPMQNASVREDLDSRAPATAVIDAFRRGIVRCAAKIPSEDLLGIGLSIPGPFDYARGICRITKAQNKYDNCFALDFRQALAPAAPGKPVVFVNDAAGFALGEYFCGGAKGYSRAIVVTLGTGFGASFLLDGKPQTGTNGSCKVPQGGELWNIPWQDGIADDAFTTRWVVSRYAKLSGRTAKGGKEIAKAALEGDANALRVYREFGENLAAFMAPWLEGFQAEAFVIGGNLANDWNLFVPHFKDALAGILPSAGKIAVNKCVLGERASVTGAALAHTLPGAAAALPPPLPESFKGIPFLAKELVDASKKNGRFRLDASSDMPWPSIVAALDDMLRAQNVQSLWFDASSEPRTSIAAAPGVLSVAYGEGAEYVPWGDDTATVVLTAD